MQMLSIVIPFYNERSTLEAATQAVLSVDLGETAKQIILVNDGSTDGSGEIATRLAESHADVICLVTLSENCGKGAAVRRGLEEVKGDFVVIQDADLEYNPQDLPRLLAAYEDGVDAVFGSRRLQSSNAQGGRLFYWGGCLVTQLTNWLYGSRLTDQPTCYKSCRTDRLKNLDLSSTGFEFCAELTSKLLRSGCRIAEVPVSYFPRSVRDGKKLRLKHGLKIGWTLWKLRHWTTSSPGLIGKIDAGPAALESRQPKRSLVGPSADALLILALVGLAMLLGCCRNQDMDIWWHLKAGHHILDGQGIPRQDTDTFAAAGHEWIDLHWGFQVLAALLFDRWGMSALTLAAALLIGVAVAIGITGSGSRRLGPFLVLIWLAAVVVMGSRYYPRPEILSLVLLAAYLGVLRRADSNPKLLWWLVPLQIVWVNVQGLFVFGPFLLSAWLADRWIHAEAPNRRRIVKETAASSAAVLLACFANPYGWRGAVFPLDLAKTMFGDGGFYRVHIGELASPLVLWQATGYRDVYVWAAALMFAAAALSFLANRRVRIFRLVLLAVFGGLALSAIRNLPQFAMVAACIVTWNLADRLEEADITTAPWRLAARMGSLFAVLLVASWSSTGGLSAFSGDNRLRGFGEYPYWHAHEAAKFVSRDGMPKRILAFHEGQSALVEFYMRDDQRVFADPRLEVMQRSVMVEYYAMAKQIAKADEDLLRQLRSPSEPTAILIDHRTHFPLEAGLLADPEWTCAWFDPVAAVYVPKSANSPRDPSGDLMARHFRSHNIANSDQSDAGDDSRSVRRLLEATALLNIAKSYRDPEPAKGIDRRVLLLLAMRFAHEAAEINPLLADRTTAQCTIQLYRFPTTEPEKWQLLELLGPARSRRLLRRCHEFRPNDFSSLAEELAVVSAVGDPDAIQAIAQELVFADDRNPKERQLKALVKQSLQIPRFDAVTGEASAFDVEANNDQQIRELFESRRFLQLNEIFSSLLLSKDLELEDLAAARERVATAALLCGETQTAREIWQQMAADDPRNSQISARLGFSWLVEAEHIRAQAEFKKAIGQNANDFEARTALAICRLEVGDAAGALRECERTLAASEVPKGLKEFCERLRDFCQHVLEVTGR